MRHTFPAVSLVMYLLGVSVAAAQVTETTVVHLRRGSTTATNGTQLSTWPTWDTCLAEARRLAPASPLVVFACASELRRVVFTALPPPPPTVVNCTVSAFTFTSATAWGVCSVSGLQTRTEIWSRTILTQPSGGGMACPVLSETRVGTQPCGPPPPPDLPVIVVTPQPMTWTGVVGAPRPAAKVITVVITGGTAGGSWQSMDTCSWVDAAPTTGVSGGTQLLTPSQGWDNLPQGTTACPIVYNAPGLPDLVVTALAIRTGTTAAFNVIAQWDRPPPADAVLDYVLTVDNGPDVTVPATVTTACQCIQAPPQGVAAGTHTVAVRARNAGGISLPTTLAFTRP